MKYYKDGNCHVAIIEKSEITKIDFDSCAQPAQTLEAYYKTCASGNKPAVLVNGGFFNMTTRDPVFNFIDDGIAKSADKKYRWGMGVVGDKDLLYGELDSKRWRDFVSGYPNLLDNSQAVKITFAQEINYKARRTLLGYNATQVIIVCVDTPGFNLVEAQAYMKKLGCKYAINLDGGGSTGMLIEGVKKTSSAYNRAVDNVVAIYTKEEKKITPTKSTSTISTTRGIDVSTLQGVIDWNKVNVDFAIIKATQGRGESAATQLLKRFTDSRFKYNITHCKCKCGTYHYLTARTQQEAIEEIDYYCNAIKPYKSRIDLWAAVDVESKYLDGLNKAELTAVVKTALDRVAYHGFKPMLYTNPSFLKYRFEPNAFDSYPIWLAHWGVKTPMSVPNLRIWQFGTVLVPGIAKECDGNIGMFETTATKTSTTEYKVGDKYTIKASDKYTTGKTVPASIVGKQYTISQINNTQTAILLKEINSWVKI